MKNIVLIKTFNDMKLMLIELKIQITLLSIVYLFNRFLEKHSFVFNKCLLDLICNTYGK